MKISSVILLILISCSFAKAQYGSGYGRMTSDTNNIKTEPKLPPVIKEFTDSSEHINFKSFLNDSSYNFCNNCEVNWDGKILYEKEYYKETEISEMRKKLKNEFYRIDSLHFLYSGYDTNNNKTAEGEVEIDNNIIEYRIDTTEVINLKGNILGLETRKYIIKHFRKYKDWIEITDNHYQYNGQYINGLKEGLWTEQRNYSKTKHSTERNLYYKEGVVIKIDTINQVLYNKPFTKKQICKFWGEVREHTHQFDSSKVRIMEVLSLNSYPQSSYQFFENNSVRIIFRDCFGPTDKIINWRLQDNKIIFWRVKGKESRSTILSYNEKYMVLGE